MEYEPEDYAAAERALKNALAEAATVHGFQRALAALASIDTNDAVDAAAAIELIANAGAIRLACGTISVRDPLEYLYRLGEQDRDAAIEAARNARIANTEAPGEREAWERSMAPVRL